MKNVLKISLFAVPVFQDSAPTVTELKISLVLNPHDCSEDLIRDLLKNYFSTPKFIRLHDIFTTSLKEHAPESKYYFHDSKLNKLHFKINYLKTEKNLNSGFVVYDTTTMIQENNVNGYIPCRCICDISFTKILNQIERWPPVLNQKLTEIQSLITPFLQNGIIC